jgi:hypothetical protein
MPYHSMLDVSMIPGKNIKLGISNPRAGSCTVSPMASTLNEEGVEKDEESATKGEEDLKGRIEASSSSCVTISSPREVITSILKAPLKEPLQCPGERGHPRCLTVV